MSNNKLWRICSLIQIFLIKNKKVAQKYATQYKTEQKKRLQKAVLSKITVQISNSHKYALIFIIPKAGPASAQTESLVENINSYSKSLKRNYNTKIALTGSNAANIDISEHFNDAIPMFMIIVTILVFVIYNANI